MHKGQGELQRGSHHGPHAHFRDVGSLDTCVHQCGDHHMDAAQIMQLRSQTVKERFVAFPV